MPEELLLCPCPICKNIPIVDSLGCSIWIVKCEVNDDHIVRVVGKTKNEAIIKWNNSRNSKELPDWLKLAIEGIKRADAIEPPMLYAAWYNKGFNDAIDRILSLQPPKEQQSR